MMEQQRRSSEKVLKETNNAVIEKAPPKYGGPSLSSMPPVALTLLTTPKHFENMLDSIHIWYCPI
jgi:hypothetical protein